MKIFLVCPKCRKLRRCQITDVSKEMSVKMEDGRHRSWMLEIQCLKCFGCFPSSLISPLEKKGGTYESGI